MAAVLPAACGGGSGPETAPGSPAQRGEAAPAQSAAPGGQRPSAPGAQASAPPRGESAADPFPVPPGRGHLGVVLREGAVVRTRPNGPIAGRLARRTPFGSPTTGWVRATRGGGRWLGLVSPVTRGARLGWVDRRRVAVRLYRSYVSLHADLSERTLTVRAGGRVRRRIPVTIGNPATPTPTGRFAVTDKLAPTGARNPYGCCIVALSGRQPNLRPGWAGGDRIAIHGSPADTAGGAASAGCLRARNSDLRALLDDVVLGTPVAIRP